MSGHSAAAAQQQIRDALAYYCRGVDRLDGETMKRGFHPGAELHDYGADALTIEQFAEYAPASLSRKFTATQHRITNTLVEFDDDDPASGAALVETYVLAFHVEAGDADADTPDLLHTFNGRYVDRFTEIDGRWRIASRTLRNDWSSVAPIESTMSGDWPASGRAGSPDPLTA
ncbi:MAG: nuclear transport factor 2 family protein [Actinomycetota bacterium]